MKATLYDLSGKKKKEMEMPKIFDSKIREDIVAKCYEASKTRQPYAPYEEAGKRHSASGTISHQRHKWASHYGKGISRIPRKTMRRSGTQFTWVGAEVSGTRGGRKAHPPRLYRLEKRVNKKEMEIAMSSAFASTGHENLIRKRYSSLGKEEIRAPIVIESKFNNTKTKDMIKTLQEIFGKTFELVMKKKEVRAGIGKRRNRRYKSNAGLLLIKSDSENIKMTGIEIRNVKDVVISDLYPLGRLTVYTEKALEEMSK